MKRATTVVWALATAGLAVALAVALAVMSRRPRRCPPPVECPAQTACPACPAQRECPAPTACPPPTECPAPTACPRCPPAVCPEFTGTNQRHVTEYSSPEAGKMALTSGYRAEINGPGNVIHQLLVSQPDLWFGLRDVVCDGNVVRRDRTQEKVRQALADALTPQYGPVQAERLAARVVRAAVGESDGICPAGVQMPADAVSRARETVFYRVLGMLTPVSWP